MSHLDMNDRFWWAVVWASASESRAAHGSADFVGMYIMGGEL